MSVGAFGDAVVLAMKASSVLLALTDVLVAAIASVAFTASDASLVLLEVQPQESQSEHHGPHTEDAGG